MSAGSMSQSIPLPREMLEALGQYKDALKDVKAELRDLEKEAKAIERKGGVVPKEMQGRLATARGERNRLEDMMTAQKANKANQRRLGQARGDVRRAFSDPFGSAGDIAIRRLEQTAIGRRVIGSAGNVAASIGSRLGQKAVFGLSGAGVLAVGAGVAGATKIYLDAKIAQEQFRARGAIGLAQTEEVFAGLGRSAAFGGSTAANLNQIIQQSRSDATSAKQAIDNGSISSLVKTLVIGGTNQGQDIEDKVAQAQARRRIKVQKFGAGFGDAIDIGNIRRKRSTQYRAEMYKEMGYLNSVTNRLFEEVSGTANTEFVDIKKGYIQALTLGIVNVGDVTASEAQVSEKMKTMGESKWEENRKTNLAKWNDTTNITMALQRADAHEAQNAITAFESDRLTRGLTWSLQ